MVVFSDELSTTFAAIKITVGTDLLVR